VIFMRRYLNVVGLKEQEPKGREASDRGCSAPAAASHPMRGWQVCCLLTLLRLLRAGTARGPEQFLNSLRRQGRL